MVKVVLIGEVINLKNIEIASICIMIPENSHSKPKIICVNNGENINSRTNGITPIKASLFTVFKYILSKRYGDEL
tara:strand:+ start:147 stop:371 length:225 start_codon:yes stop_codon:yes gene_type:complete